MPGMNEQAARLAKQIESEANKDLHADDLAQGHSDRLLADAVDLSHAGLNSRT